MSAAIDEPEAPLTFLEFFFLLLIFVPLIMLWIFTLTDLSRRSDMSGLAKGLWAVAVVLLPIIGMIVYFITRPSDPEMAKDPAVRMEEIRSETMPDTGTLDQLEKLGALRDSGALTDEEFQTMKLQLLS